MVKEAFLDSGVVLGFCFLTDMHHQKCRAYIEENDYDISYSGRVENEFEKKRKELSIRYADAVRDHISSLQKSNYEGQLTPIDIREIREDVLDKDNEAHYFLKFYYQQKVQKYIEMEDLLDQLRSISRGIERHALKKKNELESKANVWMRFDSYPELQKALKSIHGEDREICIDAHDLALDTDGEMELATTNPNDFVRAGQRKLILENTALDDVVSLAVTS